MVTKTIDIPLPDALSKLAEKPICIPIPKPSKVEIAMPTGGKIQGIVDATKAIPSDCSLSFSLVLQLQPILVNLSCLFKIIKVIEPMMDVVTGLAKVPPDAPKVAGAIPKLLEAVPPLVKCIADFVFVIPAFVRDLLMLIAKLLKCVAQGSAQRAQRHGRPGAANRLGDVPMATASCSSPWSARRRTPRTRPRV